MLELVRGSIERSQCHARLTMTTNTVQILTVKKYLLNIGILWFHRLIFILYKFIYIV